MNLRNKKWEDDFSPLDPDGTSYVDQVIAKLNLMGISMSKSTYAKLETNRINIKVSELVALAKIFHTDINAFFSGLL